MEPVTTLESIPVPFLRDDVDTDLIIPARYLKTVTRTGLGEGVFYTLRHDADGTPRPDSLFDRPLYRDSAILVAGKNFGCGSSREHAVWALVDFGYRAVIAESFADIFASNAVKNGMLALPLETAAVRAIAAEGEAGRAVHIDLAAQEVRLADGTVHRFEIAPHAKRCLLEGLDEVALTLADHAAAIDSFETRQRRERPWLYESQGHDT